MGNLPAANESYTEALALATRMENIGALVTCLIALAEPRLQEDKPEAAWRYCELTLDYSSTLPRPSFPGKLSITCGKVIEARASKAGDQGAQKAIEEALSYDEQAIEVLKHVDERLRLAEAYCLLAHLLEKSGRQSQAIVVWKFAYMTRAGLEAYQAGPRARGPHGAVRDRVCGDAAQEAPLLFARGLP